MNKIEPPTEELLVNTANELKGKKMHAYCIHFHLSKLQCENKYADNSSWLSVIKSDLGQVNSEIFLCVDFDIFIIIYTSNKSLVDKVLTNMRFFYADDPLACGDRDGENTNFAKIYNIAKDYEDFFFACNRKLIAYRENKEKGQKKMQAEDEEQKKQKTWQTALNSRKHRNKISILIVEDQAFSRQLLRESLSKEYLALAVPNASSGMDLYTANAPNIVFLDIDLPDYSGHQLLKEFLQLDPNAFVVMTTASNSEDDVKKAIMEGASGYIIKPYTKQKLNQYIETYSKQLKKYRLGEK